jgi:MoxR-like ATPase
MKTSLIRAAFFTPTRRGWGLPLVLWSEPGTAKSSIVIKVCSDMGLPVVVLSPGEMGEGAFGVVPVPGDKAKKGLLTYPAPEWVQYLDDGGVCFVDEIVCCPPAIAPALQGLLLDGRVGGTRLKRRARPFGAANPVELATTGYDLSAPNANRCGHVEWAAPTIDEHTAFMINGGGGYGGADQLDDGIMAIQPAESPTTAIALEKHVMAAWPAAWARAVSLETSFLRAQPGMKNRCPKPGDPAAARAWPSDRSWENATRALASAQVHGLDRAETESFVEAFVGGGVGREFFTFIEEQDLPDAAAVLDGTVTFKHDRARLDRTVAVINGCLALLVPADAPRRKARTEAWFALMDKVTSDDRTAKDIVIAPCGVATGAGLFKLGGKPMGEFLQKQCDFLLQNKISFEGT